MENTCGDCKWFGIAEPNAGYCKAPVPWFVHGDGYGVDFKVWKSCYQDCGAFSPNEGIV